MALWGHTAPTGGHGGARHGLSERLLAPRTHAPVWHALHSGVHSRYALAGRCHFLGAWGPWPRHSSLLLATSTVWLARMASLASLTRLARLARLSRLARLGYPRVGRHAGVLRSACPRHPVVGRVARVARRSGLRVALWVAGLHARVHLLAPRVAALLLARHGLLLAPRGPWVLAWVAAPVAWVACGGPALVVVALGRPDGLARVAVHALLLAHHLLLLLLPLEVLLLLLLLHGGVAPLSPLRPRLRTPLVPSWIAGLSLRGPPRPRGVAWGSPGAVSTIAWGILPPLAPPPSKLLLVLLAVPLARHLLALARVALHLWMLRPRLLHVFGPHGAPQQLQLAGALALELLDPGALGAEAAEVPQAVQAGQVISEKI